MPDAGRGDEECVRADLTDVHDDHGALRGGAEELGGGRADEEALEPPQPANPRDPGRPPRGEGGGKSPPLGEPPPAPPPHQPERLLESLRLDAACGSVRAEP